MARDLHPDIVTALNEKIIRAAHLVEFQTAGSPIYVWLGPATLTWDGKDFLGLGKLGEIKVIPETTEMQAMGVELSLSGIPSDMLAYALSEATPGKPVKIWLAMFTDAWLIINDPYLAFSGRSDRVDMTETASGPRIRVKCESRLIDLKRSRERRYTQHDQEIDFPDDLGFIYQESLQELNLSWGGQGPNIPLAPRLSR